MNPNDPPADYRKKVQDSEQPVNDPMQPIVWTRNWTGESGKTSKIITTTMGAATDLENEGLRRLLVNSVYWALGLEVPAKADVAVVGDYKPTFYGFNGGKKGVKPSDLELKKEQ